jgi:alginate O-acetyltransferase complex protein AlgI
MLFTEATFLFLFLPTALLLHAAARDQIRNAILLLASLVFYMWGEGKFVTLMLSSVALNYIFALIIDATRGPRKKRALFVGVAANLLALLYFKYSNFLVDNVNLLLALARLPIIGTGRVPLPLGISFLTFHTISYLTDVYRGTIRAERKLSDLALYIMLFPHLIAGPIVRYADIASEMKKRQVRTNELAYGIRRFILGLAKKMLIANQVAATADQIFGIPSHNLDAGLSWLALICYTFQIYFDFSGYSDMAIGLAHMFGFTFHENFDHPYASQSITEFWRRWHISLSSWFRDYVYIPMGGNRLRPWRVYLNLFVVFLLCGFWHGANWNFLVWGLYQGVFLVIERMGLGRVLERIWRPLRHLYLAVVVMVGWVFFRLETMGQAAVVLRAMVGLGTGDGLTYHARLYMTNELVLILVVALLAATPILAYAVSKADLMREQFTGRLDRLIGSSSRLAGSAVYLAILVLCLTFVAQKSYNPFIYFRF